MTDFIRISLITCQFFIALLLVLCILLHQPSGGGGLGSMGGQTRLAGSKNTFQQGLSRFTGGIAVLFFILSVILYITN